MSTAQTKNKKAAKPPKSRPVGTSAISQPSVEDAWTSTILSSFSPNAQLYAFVSMAVDKHRLRIFNANANQVILEDTIDRSRVTSLAWVAFNSTGSKEGSIAEVAPSKKRKTQSKTATETDKGGDQEADLVALGLEDGSILIYSTIHGRIVRTLSDTSSKSAVVAVAQDLREESNLLWAASSDSYLRLWDLSKSEMLASIKNDSNVSYSALSSRPNATDGRSELLAGSTKIDLYKVDSDSASSNDSETDALDLICTFNGHATPVMALQCNSISSHMTRFVSAAEDDRFVYLWETPEPGSSKGRMAASYPLDSPARHVELRTVSGQEILLTVASSGQITITPLPKELVASSKSKSTAKQQVPVLQPRTIMHLAAKKNAPSKDWVGSACFLASDSRSIRIAVVSGGAKVSFQTIDFLNDSGEFISELSIKLPASNTESAASEGKGPSNVRYAEPAKLAVASGSELPHDPSLDALVDREVEGALDADLAELSLGERLAARSGGEINKGGPSDIEDDSVGVKSRTRKEKTAVTYIPSHSLTRTLIQALHAGDTSLLEACLTHSDETLIKNTITRLPPQLAVPLLTACVERLGRGARGNGIKGRGGGASAQRGMALIKWVRAVLTIHSTHLMTMPDLVARLSHLYSTLTTRLTLQDRLLSLSGKLDLVIAQAELRSSHTPAPLSTQKTGTKFAGKPGREPSKYVEGESSEEEEEGQVQIESGDEDDEGSVEDIEMGTDEEEEEEEEDGSESESEEDDEVDGEENLVNGFVDDEAEEDYEDDESDEESD